MQDPISCSFQPVTEGNNLLLLQPQQQQIVKCPRCESGNTKFCYYNNYNLSQPRHFCKDCRRYWTKGGTLRNVPVGGGSRKNSSSSKRPPNPSDSPTSSAKRARDPKPEPVPTAYPNPTRVGTAASEDRMLEISGTFSSLLQSSGQLGNFLDGFGSGEVEDPNPNAVADSNPQRQLQQGESLLGWVGGWPDLAIYTNPGSTFQ